MTTGAVSGGKVEILSGLSGGETVLVGLAAPPADGAPVVRVEGKRPVSEPTPGGPSAREILHRKMTRRPARRLGPDREGVPRVEADAAPRRRVAPPRGVRAPHHAARGGAPDQGPDDRRLRRAPGRDGRGGRAARRLARREGALPDPERRVRLLDLAALGRHRDRAVPGRDGPRPGRRPRPREARRARARAPAGRAAARRRPARDRRRARRRVHALLEGRVADAAPADRRRGEGRLHAAPARRAGDRDRRPAARRERDVRPRPPRVLRRLARPGVRSALGPQLAPPGRAASPPATPRSPSRSARSSAAPRTSARP